VSEIVSYFNDFLEEIRLTPELRAEGEAAHKELRAKLHADGPLSAILISTFLQGSYRRHTGVRPLTDDDHVDVDVVVVTNVPIQTPPKLVIEQLFRPFLEQHYPKHWEPNDRSIKITPTGGRVTIDLVPTSAPSEIEQEIFKTADPGFQIEARGDVERQPLVPAELREAIKKVTGSETWQREPLWIPSRDLERWVETHPLAQIEWTEQKGGRTNGHYVNVVKAGKWWRKRHADGEYPKGYPLEHVIGVNCPDWIGSVAEGFTRTFEAIRDNYRIQAATGQVPYLRDHGVDQDVFRRITPDQFATFWRLVDGAATDARAALAATTTIESATRWRDLLGPEFPEPPKTAGFIPPVAPATPRSGGRFG
jgi:Second Messenger Oligonucleotide or Dinucleotide Synthetase domain